MAKMVLSRTEISPFAFERFVSTVGVEQPEVALKLISARLSLQLEKALKESAIRAASPQAQGGDLLLWRLSRKAPDIPISDVIKQQDRWEELEALAKAHPALFLRYIWPWFQQALEALAELKEDSNQPGFALQYGLDLRFPEEHSLGLAAPPCWHRLLRRLKHWHPIIQQSSWNGLQFTSTKVPHQRSAYSLTPLRLNRSNLRSEQRSFFWMTRTDSTWGRSRTVAERQSAWLRR
jgi:hypothetical protein